MTSLRRQVQLNEFIKLFDSPGFGCGPTIEIEIPGNICGGAAFFNSPPVDRGHENTSLTSMALVNEQTIQTNNNRYNSTTDGGRFIFRCPKIECQKIKSIYLISQELPLSPESIIASTSAHHLDKPSALPNNPDSPILIYLSSSILLLTIISLAFMAVVARRTKQREHRDREPQQQYDNNQTTNQLILAESDQLQAQTATVNEANNQHTHHRHADQSQARHLTALYNQPVSANLAGVPDTKYVKPLPPDVETAETMKEKNKPQIQSGIVQSGMSFIMPDEIITTAAKMAKETSTRSPTNNELVVVNSQKSPKPSTANKRSQRYVVADKIRSAKSLKAKK